MRRKPISPRTSSIGAAVLIAAAAAGLSGCTTLTGGGAMTIDDDAAKVLKAMSDKLASAQQFTFEARRTLDPALVAGRRIKTSATIQGAVARPDRFAGISTGGGATQKFFYDGKNVTLYDAGPNHYATVPGESTIDRMVDQIVDRWGFHPPMTDLIVSDPYASLSRRATSGKLVGDEYANGVKCHRVAVTQDAVDFDIWISVKDQLPRRMVVTFKNFEGNPQSRVEIKRWNLNPKLSSSQFNFTPPKNAQEIEMVPAD